MLSRTLLALLFLSCLFVEISSAPITVEATELVAQPLNVQATRVPERGSRTRGYYREFNHSLIGKSYCELCYSYLIYFPICFLPCLSFHYIYEICCDCREDMNMIETVAIPNRMEMDR